MKHLARRDFLELTPGLAAALPLAGLAHAPAAPAPERAAPIRLGLIGCGGRGNWISSLFKAHGGFEFTAVCDYFPERALRTAQQLQLPESACHTGLQGYRSLMASGLDAVVLQTPPYFFPDHAQAALEAGLHVYMAKPIAIDVPGTLALEGLARTFAARGLALYSDYQLPRDPVNREVAKRIRSGALGKLQAIFSSGWAGGNGYQDPPLTGAPQERLKNLVWCNDLALGGDYIVHYDIHVIDAVVWALGRMPVAALGASAAFRPSAHGDARDSSMVIYFMEDGVLWSHQGILGSYHDWLRAGRLTASLQGTQGTACLAYAGKSYVRGGPGHFSGGVPNPEASVHTNIAEFFNLIKGGRGDQGQLARVVKSNLTAILGREAAARRGYVTMEELLRENRRLIPSLMEQS